MNEKEKIVDVISTVEEKENREQFVDFIAMLINKYSNVLLNKCEC